MSSSHYPPNSTQDARWPMSTAPRQEGRGPQVRVYDPFGFSHAPDEAKRPQKQRKKRDAEYDTDDESDQEADPAPGSGYITDTNPLSSTNPSPYENPWDRSNRLIRPRRPRGFSAAASPQDIGVHSTPPPSTIIVSEPAATTRARKRERPADAEASQESKRCKRSGRNENSSPGQRPSGFDITTHAANRSGPPNARLKAAQTARHQPPNVRHHADNWGNSHQHAANTSTPIATLGAWNADVPPSTSMTDLDNASSWLDDFLQYPPELPSDNMDMDA